MADKNKPSGKKGTGEQLSQEKIVSVFQQLRMEQRTVAAKLTEMEAEKNEHAWEPYIMRTNKLWSDCDHCSTVMDALRKVDPDRRCFRMVGGVLVERTVKDVLPALQYNSDQVLKS